MCHVKRVGEEAVDPYKRYFNNSNNNRVQFTYKKWHHFQGSFLHAVLGRG